MSRHAQLCDVLRRCRINAKAANSDTFSAKFASSRQRPEQNAATTSTDIYHATLHAPGDPAESCCNALPKERLKLGIAVHGVAADNRRRSLAKYANKSQA